MMLSNALQKSTNTITADRFFSLTPSKILRRASTWLVVDFLGRKPAWFPRSSGQRAVQPPPFRTHCSRTAGPIVLAQQVYCCRTVGLLFYEQWIYCSKGPFWGTILGLGLGLIFFFYFSKFFNFFKFVKFFNFRIGIGIQIFNFF